MYEWNWRIISFYKLVFVQGALVTIELTFFAVIFGTALGVAIAFLKKTRNPIFLPSRKFTLNFFEPSLFSSYLFGFSMLSPFCLIGEFQRLLQPSLRYL